MKKIQIILILSLAPFLASNIQAEKAYEYLRKKLNFYYYKDANTKNKPIKIDNAKLENYASFSKSKDFEKAYKLVESLINPPKKGGHLALQQRARQVLNIREVNISIYFVNDITPIQKSKTHSLLKNKGIHVWPHAHMLKEKYKKFCNCLGAVFWGIHYMNKESLNSVKATFIHELFHTQDYSDGRVHKIGGGKYQYGADGHYFTEVLPLPDIALKEAIGTALGYEFDKTQLKKFENWFESNGNLLVEKVKPSGYKGKWVYDDIRKSNGEGSKCNQKKIQYRCYKIKDLKPSLIVHNESILSLIIYNFIKYRGAKTFLQAFKGSNLYTLIKTDKDKNKNHFSELVSWMSSMGLPDGIDTKTKSWEVSNKKEALQAILENQYDYIGPELYLLPIAYVDYFTGFKTKNPKEFKEVFENQVSDSLLKLYFGSKYNDPDLPQTRIDSPRDRLKQNGIKEIEKELRLGSLERFFNSF